MLREIFTKSNVYLSLLHKIDLDLAEEYRLKGCPHCNGPLHSAYYVRKPRGIPIEIPDKYCLRLSLCCGRSGCRRRNLPPSCLFWGRRVYLRAVVLVVTVLRQEHPRRVLVRELVELFGVTPRTIRRWVGYFRDVFPSSSYWRHLRGRVGTWVGRDRVLHDLLKLFIDSSLGDSSGGLYRCIEFMVRSEISFSEHGS